MARTTGRRRHWSSGSSSRRSRSAGRSRTAWRSSGPTSAGSCTRWAASPPRRRCSSSSVRRSCAAACRRCSSSRAAPKRPARTRSTSRRATRRFRAAPIRPSRRSSRASPSPDATLMVRIDPAGQFERVPLVAGRRAGSVRGHAVPRREVDRVLRRVERRPLHHASRWTCVDLPTVDKLVLEYHFPAYTGLEPRTVDPGGDIAAIKGTEVRLKITPTMATPGGRVHAERERVAAADEGSRRHVRRRTSR